MNHAIDLSRLGAPEVLEPLNYDQIYQEMENELALSFEDYALLESDPAIKVLQIMAMRETLLRQRVNDSARSVLLAYAKGNDLDNLGVLFGVMRDENEDDERYRARIPLSLESHSMAGTMGAYQYQAFSASTDVKDVFVSSMEPGIVDVYILPKQYSDTNQLKKTVLAHLNDDEIRPLTDLVKVHIVEPQPYAVSASVYFNAGVNTDAVKLEINLALDQFFEDHYKLGKEVPFSGMIDALHQAGVRKVVLASPQADISVSEKQAAMCNKVSLSYP